ncbi:MAG: glycine cleavage system protein T [Rhodospirillaceae bacterium]|nr:glycine cleavage system protein T [Rhodospirillaceae bacterium]
MSDHHQDPLLRTPLYDLHVARGGRMVPFAGYAMPVQYPTGIIAEHRQTRESASLFDVSHMGQVRLRGAEAAKALETLVPGDIQGLKEGRIRYTLFTADNGGILDDLMVTNAGDHLHLVVNAACREADIAHLERGLGGACAIEVLSDRALLALQGPKAATALARLAPESAELGFMRAAPMTIDGVEAFVSRSGYTGEDGFEISIPADAAERLAAMLLDQPEIEPAGLGARDSLRLEAGLCLYGHDIDTGTTPIEADLAWTISKRRREEGGFPGAEKILAELKDGVPRKRVGFRLEGRGVAREGAEIVDSDGRQIGVVTSGTFGPTVEAAIGMAYVEASAAGAGTPISATVRERALAGTITPMPFVPHRYHKS